MQQEYLTCRVRLLPAILRYCAQKRAERFQFLEPAGPDESAVMYGDIGTGIAHALTAILQTINGLNEHDGLQIQFLKYSKRIPHQRPEITAGRPPHTFVKGPQQQTRRTALFGHPSD